MPYAKGYSEDCPAWSAVQSGARGGDQRKQEQGLGWKDLLRKKERQLLLRVLRLGKILVASKILESDLFLYLKMPNFSKQGVLSRI